MERAEARPRRPWLSMLGGSRLTRIYRSAGAVLLAAILAGCSSSPLPSASLSDGGTPPASTPGTPIVSPTPDIAPASPSARPSGSPALTPGAPLPAGRGGFVTPRPPKAGAAWTGIRWRRLQAKDPLAHVRSVTRWPGGYVATGDVVIEDGKARTKVWVSTDGRSWRRLGADDFGKDAIVTGVAALPDRILAMTMGTAFLDDEERSTEPDHQYVRGPWRFWTSTDGITWQAQPAPDFPAPTTFFQGALAPTLVAGGGNDLVALTMGGHPLAYTRDGATWETADPDALPGGPAGWAAADFAGFPPGFVSVGDGQAIASADGRAWEKTLMSEDCSSGELSVARDGMIVSFEVGDPHTPQTTWCWSPDGKAWRVLRGLPPLGYAREADECRGTCPGGRLLADGERMIAYRGYPRQAGWTSFDGRTWTRLALSGARPRGWGKSDGYQFTTLLLPNGLLFINTGTGAAWFGVPRT